MLESLDQLLIFESDHSILNIYYANLMIEEPVLWLIGEYVYYIDEEVVLNNRKATRHGMIGYLESRRLACNFLRIPHIGHIPGMQLI